MTVSDASNRFEPIDAGPHSPADALVPKGRRGLGVGAIVFFVISAAAPMTTAAVSIPTTIAVTGNLGMPLFYLIAGAILLLFAVGFSMMTRHVHNAGAFYSYIQAGLGRIPGLGAAAVAMLSYYLLQIAMTVFLGVGGSNLLAAVIGTTIPWPVISVVLWALIAVFGYLNVELSAKVLGALLVLEALAVVIVNIAVLTRSSTTVDAAASFAPTQAFTGSWSVALMFAFLGFIGFEATAVFRREARDPERTVPRATSLALILIGVFYALSSWAIIAAILAEPELLADPSTLFLNIAGAYASPIMFPIVGLFIVTSLFAASLSFQNVIARYQFTLARAGALPARLGVINERHQTPSFSSVVVSGITIVFVLLAWASGLDPMLQVNAWLSGAATLGVVILMALTSIAVVIYFRRHPAATPSVWRTVVAPALSALLLLALVAIVLANFSLLVGDPATAIVVAASVFVAFGIGALGAVLLRRHHPARYRALGDH